MKMPIIAALLLACAAPLGAIELSLEENRAERGNIGFVDMRRIFQLFPETLHAKESFAESVRQAEEQLNLRKAEVLRLRAELDMLTVERETLALSTPSASAAPLPKEGASPSTKDKADYDRLLAETPAVPPAAPAEGGRRHAAQPETPPQSQEVAASSAPAAAPLIVNLPGLGAAPPIAEPAGDAGPEGPAPQAQASAPDSATTPELLAQATTQASAPLSPLAELDGKIAQKTEELRLKETTAKEQQAATERNLLDLESRKSEILLGKIYRAVVEVAHREGVSVVVDKSGILYGHSAVDLTDKVLKHLQGG